LWQDRIAESDVIINLAGLSVFRRWDFLAKQSLLKSRLVTTQKIVEALSFRQNTDKTLLSMSGVGYYGAHGDEILTETHRPGTDFLANMAKEWEAIALSASQFGVRVICCRLGNVLSRQGGMFPRLAKLARFHLGTRWGNGQQWNSWIHAEDLTRILVYFLENKSFNGPVNVTAPEPLRNVDMMKLISRRMRRTPWLPYVPEAVLKLAAGEMASIFLTGQRVVPGRLLASKFSFRYPTLGKALDELIP
jgi:uncharacterized protein (TIGR01777 family)